MWTLFRIFVGVVAMQTGSALAADDSMLVLGRRLLAEHQCNGACHQSRAPGSDPLAFYTRPNRKVNDLDALRRQVARCLSNVNPPASREDVDAITAVLANDFYKFP